MSKTILILVAFATTLLGCVGEVSPVPTDENIDLSRIYGTVRDQTGVAVSGVGLTLTGPGNAQMMTESSETTGSYVFWSLISTMGAGEYRLSVTTLPAGFSVPPSQPNPVTVQLLAVPGELQVDLQISRD